MPGVNVHLWRDHPRHIIWGMNLALVRHNTSSPPSVSGTSWQHSLCFRWNIWRPVFSLHDSGCFLLPCTEKELRSTFWCCASIIYAHAPAFYCVLRFHYFSLFQGVLCVFQLASQGDTTSVCQSKYTAPHCMFTVPYSWRPLGTLQCLISFIDLQAWRMRKNINDHYFQRTFVCRCGWLPDSPKDAASLNTEWPECGNLKCYVVKMHWLFYFSTPP